MVKQQISNLRSRVRFSYPAPDITVLYNGITLVSKTNDGSSILSTVANPTINSLTWNEP